MRKFRPVLLVIILLVLVLLPACNSKTSPSSMEEYKAPEDYTLEDCYQYIPADIEERYPGKSKLVWVIQKFNNDNEVLEQLNELLVDRGSSFVVQFLEVNDLLLDALYKEQYSGKNGVYFQFLLELMENNVQVDLIFTGWKNVEEPSDQYYPRIQDITEAGLLQPINQYLSSEKGIQLKETLQPAIWDTYTLNGLTYAVSNHRLGVNYIREANLNYLEKYQIDPEDLTKELWELEDILKTVYEGENGTITPYVSEGSYTDIPELPYDRITAAIGLDPDDPDAEFVNVYKQEYTTKLLQTIQKYHSLGYYRKVYNVGDYNYNKNSLFIRFGSTPFRTKPNEIYQETKSYVEVYNEDGNTKQIVSEPFEVLNIDWSHYIFHMNCNASNGIASWSCQAEQAFEMLYYAYTDKEIANLLYHGIMGRNYELENGYAIPLPMSTDESYYTPIANMSPLSNGFLTYPTVFNYEEPTNKEECYKMHNDHAVRSSIFGFRFDRTGYEDKIQAMDDVLKKSEYQNLWTGEVESVEKTLHQLVLELKEVGIDEVVNGANQQLAEWRNAQS